MTTVAEITGAVKRLPKKELARFRKWFAEYACGRMGPSIRVRRRCRSARHSRS